MATHAPVIAEKSDWLENSISYNTQLVAIDALGGRDLLTQEMPAIIKKKLYNFKINVKINK